MHRHLKITILLLLCFFVACTGRRQESFISESDKAVNAGDYFLATKELRKAVGIDSESRLAIKARYKLGHILEVYLKDPSGALLSFNEFIDLNRDPISQYEVLKRVANIYFQGRRNPEKAIEIYQRLMAESPESLEADFFQFRLALSYFQQNEFEKTRNTFQQLLELYPKSQHVARARYEIGNTYYMQGQYQVAVQALKQVLRSHSQSEYAIEAQFLMATCRDHLGDLRGAIQLYEGLKGRYSPQEVLNNRIKDAKRRLRKAG